jgi:hypothetical protein
MLHGLDAFSATFLWYHVFSKGAFDMLSAKAQSQGHRLMLSPPKPVSALRSKRGRANSVILAGVTD